MIQEKMFNLGRARDLSGLKFNRLAVISFSYKQGTKYYWNCLCDCGEKAVVRGDMLKLGRSGGIQSCGCLNEEERRSKRNIAKLTAASYRHGMSKSRFWKIWSSMNERCTLDKKNKIYKYYGLKGVTVSLAWRKFETFKNDMYQSYLNHVKEHGEKQTTIDRVNNNKGYCKENCRWATFKKQANNRCTNIMIQGRTLSEWAEESNVSYACFGNRIRKGWPLKEALTKISQKNDTAKNNHAQRIS